MNVSSAEDGALRLDEALRRLPSCWRAAVAGCAIEPAAGMGGAPVFRLSDERGGCRYLKLAWGREAQRLRAEIARTEWLASRHVRVAEFLMKTCTDEVVACLMTAVPGRSLTSEPAGTTTFDLPAAARAIGRGLARLHGVPVADCPFDEMPRIRLARAFDDIAHGRIDASQFDDRNAGVAPDTLYRRLAGIVPVAADDDIVVVHGDATLDNMLIGPDGELGFLDCGHAGRSDRYLDLAVVEMDLHAAFGRDSVEAFIAAYGIRHWDDRKAAFFRDLYELF